MTGRLEWLDAIVGTKGGWEPSDLDSSERAVALALLSHMNRAGQCHVSQRTLEVGSSLSRNTVSAAINRMEKRGWLTVNRTRGRAGNTYQATIPNGAPRVSHSQTKKWRTQNEPLHPDTCTRNGSISGPKWLTQTAPEAISQNPAIEP